MADLVDRERQAADERKRREEWSSYDTISMVPVGPPGRHRLREANQWPTMPQTLMAEASN
jgi:hypothetical protein